MRDDIAPETDPTPDTGAAARPWWPYVLPMAVFLVLTALEDQLPKVEGQPHPFWYPAAYTVKMAVVLALIAIGRTALKDLRPRPSGGALALAVAVGIAVAVAWVGLERLPYPKFGLSGTRQAFNPYVLPPAGRVAFLAVRLFGLVLLVPVMEELFWRSFVIRFAIDADFGRVPIGTVTPTAAAISSALFAAAHPEWLPALLTGLAWAWLLWKTKSLGACVVSHAVANLALGLYVLATGNWQLW
jgi:CAAX prenyl protease-like protein